MLIFSEPECFSSNRFNMWMETVVILTVSILVSCEHDFRKFDNYNDESEKTIAKTVVSIINTFYLESTSVVNFISTSLDEKALFATDAIMDQVLTDVDSRVSVFVEDHWSRWSEMKTDRKKTFNVLFVDSYESFRKIIAHMEPDQFNYQGFYLIAVTTYRKHQYKEMKQMFEDLWANYIVNVNIIQAAIHDNAQSFLYTYFPYSEYYCEEVHPVLLNTFNDSAFIKTTNLFPNKMSNLHGCPIVVALFEIPPFIIFNKDRQNGITGFDGIFLRHLAMEMNFKLVKKISNKTFWGSLDDDGSSSGAIRMVMEKQANFTVGYFMQSPLRNKWMSTSIVYYTSNLVWVIPPAPPITALQRFSKPFRYIIWICVISIFIISIIVILFVQRRSLLVRNFVFGNNVKSPMLELINVSLGGSMLKLPTRNFARTLLAMFIFYTLIIRNAYTGSLFRFLRMDNGRQDIKSIKDMLDKDFRFIILDVTEEYVKPFENIREKSIIMNIHQVHALRPQFLNTTDTVALLTSEDHVAYWNKLGFPKSFYNTCPQRVTSINLCVYMHKTTCLTSEINKHILNFNSNGLMQIFKQLFIDKAYLKKKSVEDEPQKLTNEKLKGGYLFLITGLLISTICFVVEVLKHVLKERLR